MYGHHSAAGVMTSESGKTTPEVVELNLQEVGLNLDVIENNKMKQSASDNFLHVRKSSMSLSSSFSDLEDMRTDKTRMSTMSLQSLSSQGKNSSFREEIGSKSVTFAEKLISQEISFDAADTRYDSASLDCSPAQPTKNMQHKMLDMETSVTDFRQNNTGVGDTNSQNSTKTAFQLKEHFEKLNQQNISNGFNKSGSGLQTSDVADRQRVNSKENIALKVLADVSSQRTAVECMQRQSIIQSQEANRKLREERGLANYPVLAQRKLLPATSQVKDNSLASISNVDLEQHVNSLKINNSSQKLPTGSDVISRFNGGQQNVPGQHSYPLPSSVNQPIPLPRKQAKPQQSAYNALFPLGGPNKSPSPRIAFNHSNKPVTSSPSILPRHLTSAQTGSGTGENSISSDHSEGAESNLQSSASSGYHSENSGLLGQAQTIPPPSHVSQDKGLYTQEFVNRTPSFTYSSGSSSPFSRASNDETGTDNGPDRPNINPLSNVLFPNQTPKQSLPVSSRSVNIKRHPMNTNQSAKSFAQPAVPLVRTNALQARPESSNSMSSQYSTSSSTLSTIYRPLGTRDSPKSRDQTSPMLNTGAHYTSVPPPPYSHTGYKTISPVSPSSHSFYPSHNPSQISSQKTPESHLHNKLSNPAPLDCYASSPNAVRRTHGSDQQFKTSSETKNYSMLDSNSNWDLENGDDYKSRLAAAQSNMYNPKSKLATGLSGYGDSRSSFQSFQSGSYGQNFIPMKTFNSNSAANAGGVKDRLQNKLEQDYHDPRVKDQHGYVIHSSKC